MKSISLLMLILLFGFSNTFAQDSSFVKLNSAKLTGIVQDAKDNSPIEADIILFYSKDTVKISGTKCDSSGKFILSAAIGNYKIEINAVGYASITIENIKVLSADTTILLAQVKLKKQDITTEEINVEEQKPLMTFEGDKKVFNVAQSMLNKGGTALDVLRKVPLIDVDINDNVTLRGSTNVKILIDDKPNRYVNLKQLPADQIEKVEIITNPPAKYEAEGVTGIINIVLKKIDMLGYNGSVYGDIGSKDKYSGSLNANLKKKNITFFGSGYAGVYHYSNTYNTNVQYFIPLTYLLTNGGGTGKSHYFGGNAGVEYDVKKGHTVGLEGSFSNSGYDGSEFDYNNNQDSLNNMTSFYTGNSFYNGSYKSYYLSLYYNGKLNDKGRELSGDLTYSDNTNSYTSQMQTQYFNGNGIPVNNTPRNENDYTNNKNYNLNAQLDYTHPITEKTKLEAGYKGTFRMNDNNYNSDTLNYDINAYVNDLSVSNRFKLSDRINAVYGMFSSGYKGFTFKLGLRFEHTFTKGELVDQNQIFTKNYLDVFPTLNLSQRIGMMDQVQFNYSRRITRPMIYRLNPFVSRGNPKFIYFGNPELNPEFTDSYELSFMFYSKILTVTPMAFFRQSHDVISSYSYLTDSNVSITTYRNAAGSKAYGMDLMLSSQTLAWLNLNATFSFYDTKFDPDVYSDYAAEEGFSWKANARAYITIGKILNLEFFYYYTGKKVNAQGINLPSSQFTMGISKNFIKDKLTVNLRASDIFKTMQWGRDVNAVGYSSSSRNIYNSRVFYFSLSYNFGNTDEYYQKKKKTKQNQNENNDQQDNGNGK
jgi:outer membrane receptor protein involved in Fe transport